MAQSSDWYGVVDGPILEQGDLLPGCPILLPDADLSPDEFTSALDAGETPGWVEFADVVVMSQTCDLAHGKIASVMLCCYHGLDELAAINQSFASRGNKEKLRQGSFPPYHLLNRCETGDFDIDLQVVDFRATHGMPLPVVCGFAANLGSRLRLLPPYREHLAQAFARFFMRVGLPVDIPPFK